MSGVFCCIGSEGGGGGGHLFFMYWPAAQTSPELIFHVINMSKDASVLLSVGHGIRTHEGLIKMSK